MRRLRLRKRLPTVARGAQGVRSSGQDRRLVPLAGPERRLLPSYNLRLQEVSASVEPREDVSYVSADVAQNPSKTRSSSSLGSLRGSSWVAAGPRYKLARLVRRTRLAVPASALSCRCCARASSPLARSSMCQRNRHLRQLRADPALAIEPMVTATSRRGAGWVTLLLNDRSVA
jgi:hypothetical protein